MGALPVDVSESPDPANAPTVTCTTCGNEWELAYELEELHAGNQALEQFALDHRRHTGHYPDGVTPWIADCEHCPDGERFFAERPARRWAQTHARHTSHSVALTAPADATPTIVCPEGEE